MISKMLVDELNKKLEIGDIARNYCKNLSSFGKLGHLRCTSIFNTEEKTPSMVIYANKNNFFDFSSKKYGGPADILIQVLDLTTDYELKQQAMNHGVESFEYNNYVKTKKPLSSKERINAEIYRDFVEVAKYELLYSQNKEGLEYLTRRGYSLSIIDEFDLGFISKEANLVELFLSKGYKEEQLVNSGIFDYNSDNELYCHFHNRILLPFQNVEGNFSDFQGRSIEDQPINKYLNMKMNLENEKINKKTSNFVNAKNLMSSLEHNEVIIVEGYFDLLRLADRQIRNVFVLRGSNFTEDHMSQLKYIENFILMLDSDSVGESSNDVILKELVSDGKFNVRIFKNESYVGDPDSHFSDFSGEESKTQIRESKIAIWKFVENEIEKYKNDTSVSIFDLFDVIGNIITISKKRNEEYSLIISKIVEEYYPADINAFDAIIESQYFRDNSKLYKTIYLADKLNLELLYSDKIIDKANIFVEKSRKMKSIEQYIQSEIKRRYLIMTKDHTEESFFMRKVDLDFCKDNLYNNAHVIGRSKISLRVPIVKDDDKPELIQRLNRKNNDYIMIYFNYLQNEVKFETRIVKHGITEAIKNHHRLFYHVKIFSFTDKELVDINSIKELSDFELLNRTIDEVVHQYSKIMKGVSK